MPLPWPIEAELHFLVTVPTDGPSPEGDFVADLLDDPPALAQADGEGPLHGWELERTQFEETPMGGDKFVRCDIFYNVRPPG